MDFSKQLASLQQTASRAQQQGRRGGGGETSRGTNLYWPEPKNDKFEYHPNDTIYQSRREDINGTNNPGTKTIFKV